MNRERLEGWKKSLGTRPNADTPTVWDLYNVVDALLEESPDVGPESQPRWRDGVEARLQGLARRIEGLEARTREVTPADTLQALTSVEARMDRLEAERYGPPDVGPTHEWVTEAEAAPKDMKEVLTTLGRQLTQIDALVGQAAGGLAPKRGATPCPVCLSNICRGDVDARGCDTRVATRKAITP